MKTFLTIALNKTDDFKFYFTLTLTGILSEKSSSLESCLFPSYESCCAEMIHILDTTKNMTVGDIEKYFAYHYGTII